MLKVIYSDIGLLESCNLRCQMCKMYEIKPLKKNDLISLEKWELFFEDLRKISGHGFVFNLPGGEPLLHPQIFEIIKIASEKGLKPLLSTNGYLLTREIAEKLILSGLFAVTISIDSSIPEIHDKIRGVKNTFYRANKGMEYLDYFSKKYGKDFEIGVQGVIQKTNIENIVDLVKWVEKNPLIKRVNLNLLMQPNNTSPNKNWYKEEFNHLWPDYNKTTKVFDELIRLKKENKIKKLLNSINQFESYNVYFKNPQATPKLVKCNYDKSLCTNSSGDIHLCYYYDNIGNVNEDRLIEVWESEKANNVRNQIAECKITDCWFRLNCLFSN